MTRMNRAYNDESRAEYDRIFGHEKLKLITKLKFIQVDGTPIEIDVNKITEAPEDISTFDDKDRVLIKCGDNHVEIRGSYSEIDVAIHNAWKGRNKP